MGQRTSRAIREQLEPQSGRAVTRGSERDRKQADSLGNCESLRYQTQGKGTSRMSRGTVSDLREQQERSGISLGSGSSHGDKE